MAHIWQSMGTWEGGTVLSLALAPQPHTAPLILAATAAGLYRSTDGGTTWQASSMGITDPNLLCVHFTTDADAPHPPAFAASQGGRLFQSVDGGQAWHEVAGWQGFGAINALISSPAYAHDQTLFAATAEGVFRSQDGGTTWESSTFGLIDLAILCLAIDPGFAQSETLWAGSAAGGLYRSRNGARSWRDSGNGLPDTALLCLALAPNFATSQTLYVGTEEHGLYRSTDGGTTWAELSSELAGLTINCLTLSADGQSILVGSSAGILRSTDGGAQWQAAEAGEALVFTFATYSDGTLLAGSYLDGVLCASAGGEQWEGSNRGLAAHAPPVARWDSSGRVFALDREGVLAVTADGGAHWPTLNHLLDDQAAIALADVGTDNLLLVLSESTLVTLAPDDEGVLEERQVNEVPTTISQPTLLTRSPAYAQDQTLWVADAQGQLFVSTKAGSAWEPCTAPAAEQLLIQLAFAPSAGPLGQLYAVTAGEFGPTGYPMQLAISQDRGASWVTVADFTLATPALSLLLQEADQRVALWLGAQQRILHFYQGTNGEWAFAQHFLTEPVQITGLVRPTGQLWPLYLTTTAGIYRSDDGQSWQSIDPVLEPLTWVALHVDEGGQPRYAVALGGQLWRAGD